MVIATLFKSATGKGFGASLLLPSGRTVVFDKGWSRAKWREQARLRGYGRGSNARPGLVRLHLNEVRYVSAYPHHADLIARFDRSAA